MPKTYPVSYNHKNNVPANAPITIAQKSLLILVTLNWFQGLRYRLEHEILYTLSITTNADKYHLQSPLPLGKDLSEGDLKNSTLKHAIHNQARDIANKVFFQ